jgi:multidrug efflux system outer membrane protein
VGASNRAADLSLRQYKEGALTYLDVIDAQRTVLQAQRTAVELTGVQAVATVNLIRALGGGWGSAPAVSDAADVANVANVANAANAANLTNSAITTNAANARELAAMR